MKKLIKAVCSALCVTAVAMPATALATPDNDTEEIVEDVAIQHDQPGNYHLAFVTGDFGLQFAFASPDQPLGALFMFVSDHSGKIVKNAQVVTTIIDQVGRQVMQRARPLKGGYLIDTMELPPGAYRLEAEIATNGQLLTDDFPFQKT